MTWSTEDPIVQQRIALLDLARDLKNVSEACRRLGFSRTQFYVYKKRYEKFGLEGLKDRPPISHSHPNVTPPETKEEILALCLQHPSWGCDRLSDHLVKNGTHISSQTVQNILNQENLGTRRDRWLLLETRRTEEADLTREQNEFLEKQNPVYRDRHLKGDYPGALVTQFAIKVGKLADTGFVYAHAVVDTCSNYAFARLYPSKKAEAAVSLLQGDVLTFFADIGLNVEAVLTNNGPEYCGQDDHNYEAFLRGNGIEHLQTRPKRRHTTGFLQRFRIVMLDEFFKETLETRFYRSIDDLQADLDEWLDHYNTSRPHMGYPNMGSVPFDTIQSWLDDTKVGEIVGELHG